MSARNPNRASTVYLGKDGDWHGRVTMGFRDNGAPDRRHVRGKTKGEVVKKVRVLERLRDEGAVQRAGQRWTIETWLAPLSQSRRMRDSNPRGREPNPLSKSANRSSG